MVKRKNKKQEIKKFKKSIYKKKRPIKRIILKDRGCYVLDTSALIKNIATKLVMKGLAGTFIIHNAVVSELEHLANKGKEEGFHGLEELAKLQKLKKKYKFKIRFTGKRPSPIHIKYAKYGEIDALVRELAYKNKAVLITADYVQAKSALAYGIKVKFIETRKKEKPKKGFKISFFRKRKK